MPGLVIGNCSPCCGGTIGDPTDPNDDAYWGSPIKGAVGYVGWHQKFPFGYSQVPEPITKGFLAASGAPDGFRMTAPLPFACNGIYIEYNPNQVLANFNVAIEVVNYGRPHANLNYSDQSDLYRYSNPADGQIFPRPLHPLRRYKLAVFAPFFDVGSHLLKIYFTFPYPQVSSTSVSPGFEMKVRITYFIDPRGRQIPSWDPDWPTIQLPW